MFEMKSREDIHKEKDKKLTTIILEGHPVI